MAMARTLCVLLCASQAYGHGHIIDPPSRAELCSNIHTPASEKNTNCGQIMWEPFSIEGPDGWPADGTIPAGGGHSRFPELNEQTATRWGKVPMSGGATKFTWTFNANHVTKDYTYYMTRAGWNPNAPLTRATFEDAPFCVVDGGMKQPPMTTDHTCNVPTLEGYHIILSVWDVGDTSNSFFNVIDVMFSGGGSPPVPVPTAPVCALPSGLDANVAAVDNTGFATCHGKLRLSGLQLVGAQGEAVQLMGQSSHGLHWFGHCSTKESITHLVTRWGINVFRASMYIGEGGYRNNPALKQTVLDIVQWCKELGIYVIVDWHMLTPGNPNDGVYVGADAFWQDMARTLKDETHVLYEIANEPNGVSWGEVLSYHNRILALIRAEDAETVVLAGTPTWSQDIHEAAARPVDLPHNVMYVFHFYAGAHMNLLSRVQEVASQIPLFVSEWGTSEASGDGGPFLDNAYAFLGLLKSAGSQGVKLSWASWSLADKAEVSAALQPGACVSGDWDRVSCSGSFVRTYIRTNAVPCGGATSPPTPSTPEPTLVPVPSSGGCTAGVTEVAVWGNCEAAPHCCASGSTCYEQDQWYAQCKPSCSTSDGWTCRVLGAGSVTTPPTPTVPEPTPPTPPTPTAPVPAPVPTVSGSGSDSRMIAFLGNWQACPTDAQLEHYTHIMISFAVTYTWNAAKNVCDTSCNIGAPVPVCENQAHPDLVARWRAAGKKVVVSFGGAGMGGSWAGDVNDCWDYCFGKEAHVVSQLTSIVSAQNFDGVDIDYEYFHEDGGARGFTRGAEAQTFLRDVTVGLKQQLPVGSLVTHAPMEPDMMPGRGYYNVMQATAASVDFVMPQYYNANSRPALDGLAGGSGRISAGDHFRTLVDNVFGGDATRVVFGFCIGDCSGTGSNADAAAGVRVMQELAVQHPCNGGAFFWVVEDDTNGDWSGTVGAVVEATRGCSSGGGGTPPTPPVVSVPPPTPPTPTVPEPTPPTPPVPVPSSGGCTAGGAEVAVWGNCEAAPHCCASGSTCYEKSQWYAQCKPSCSTSDGWTCRVLGAGSVTTPPTPPTGCSATIPEWGECLGNEDCCAAGLQCTGTQWWKSCKQ